MKKILMTRLSVCSLGVSCNEMIDTPMLLVVKNDLLFSDVFYSHLLNNWSSIDLKTVLER